MKEKLKDVLAVILVLLSVAIWCSIGFNLSRGIITLEVICGVLLIGVVGLMHKK